MNTTMTNMPTLPMPGLQRLLSQLTPGLLLRLFAGGAAGLFIWEIWARVFTKAVLGYPLEPAGLIDAIFQHNLGWTVPHLAREALHYLVGIVGYPLVYLVLSRLLRHAGTWLDGIVFVTFTAGVIARFAGGNGSGGLVLFWIAVVALIATRRINPSQVWREAISWGNFTWLNALGIMAPLGGLSFYLLGEGGDLSFMSFAGHVIYGAVAVWVFETWQAKATSA